MRRSCIILGTELDFIQSVSHGVALMFSIFSGMGVFSLLAFMEGDGKYGSKAAIAATFGLFGALYLLKTQRDYVRDIWNESTVTRAERGLSQSVETLE